MKKSHFIIILSIIFLIAVISGYTIATHLNGTPIFSSCPYEHGECPVPGCDNHAVFTVDPREYQLQLEMEGTYIYEGDRRVGFLPYDSTQAFDKLILKDNE